MPIDDEISIKRLSMYEDRRYVLSFDKVFQKRKDLSLCFIQIWASCDSTLETNIVVCSGKERLWERKWRMAINEITKFKKSRLWVEIWNCKTETSVNLIDRKRSVNVIIKILFCLQRKLVNQASSVNCNVEKNKCRLRMHFYVHWYNRSCKRFAVWNDCYSNSTLQMILAVLLIHMGLYLCLCSNLKWCGKGKVPDWMAV